MQKITMRRMLVTGGAGFIGSNFISFWIKEHPEDRIVNLDKLTYAGSLENLEGMERHPSYRFVHGDIGEPVLIERLFEEEEIDTIVHFAAESHVDRSILGPEEFIRTNIGGTFTLLQAARRRWEGIVKSAGFNGPEAFSANKPPFCFLHVSTDEVYGSLNPEDPPSNETHPYSPRSPYSASKAAADHLVRAYHYTYGLPAIVTHCSNNYGPYQLPEKLVPLTIQRCLGGEPIPLYGKGQNVRDWIYVKDHCSAVAAVLENGRSGETYNIGGGNQWTNLDLINFICDRMDDKLGTHGSPRRSLIRFVEDRPGHDLRYAMDISKITRELGWQAKEPIEIGIDKTIDWYLTHKPWVSRVITGEYQKYFAAQYGSRLAPVESNS